MDPADDPNIPNHQVWAYHVTLDASKLIQWAYNTADAQWKTDFLRQVVESMEEGAACLKELAVGGHRGALVDRLGVALKLRERGIDVDDFKRRLEGP